jgi:diguanylate cyclase (GGDEF)-like protein
MSETKVEIPKILKQTKVVMLKGPNIGNIRDARVAQEEANSTLELIGKASPKGYNIDDKAKKELNSRAADYLVTSQADKTVRAEKAAEKSNKFAIYDSLTGLFSRRYFDEQLNEELSESQRLKMPLGLAFGDIRKLKDINDAHGHANGDKLLQEVASSIQRSTLRHSDIPCRFGGDEDAVIYPVIQPEKQSKTVYSAKDGLVIASIRMVREIHNQNLTMSDNSPVTPYMDTGVTLSVPNDTAELIFDRVDQAVYLAKKTFRPNEDKVIVATWTPNRIEFEVAEIVGGKVLYSPIPKAK